MSTLYVTGFVTQGMDLNGRPLSVATLPVTEQQTVSITATTVSSTAFQNNTNLVRLHSDTTCSFSFGTSPTATTTNARMAANQTEYFSIPGGLSYKVAVISN